MHGARWRGRRPLLRGSSQEPWDPDKWDGNIVELRQRMTGLTIPHELQCEIHLILEQAEPQRYAELLAFLINTASQFSQQQRDRILALDLRYEGAVGTTAVLQQYQIPLTVLRQWHENLERLRLEEQEQMQRSDEVAASQSDSEYEPSPDNYQNTPLQERRMTTRQQSHAQSAPPESQADQPKRAHTLTLIEGEKIRLVLRSNSGPIPVVKQAASNGSDPSPEQALQRQQERQSWADQWQLLRTSPRRMLQWQLGWKQRTRNLRGSYERCSTSDILMNS
jgi:hypothetical protein